MIVVWLYLLVSLAVLAMGVYFLVLYLRGDPGAAFASGRPAPRWLWPFAICFGLLGVLSSAPGVILHQSGWFIDKFFWLLSRL
jgi:hypothetical protein